MRWYIAFYTHLNHHQHRSAVLRIVSLPISGCFDHSFVTVLLGADLPYDPLLPEFALLIGDHDAVVS